jgi:hypothetical protein
MNNFLKTLALTALFFGCATGSGPAATKAPEWALNPPTSLGQDALFVGSGVSETGNEVEARDQAIQRIKEQIMDYIGVSVTSVTTGAVAASLDSFQGQLETSLRSESSAELSGFRLGETVIAENNGMLFVYLQGLYNQNQLDRKKAEFEQKVRENQFAVEGVEAEADDLLDAGNVFGAITKYIQAAGAAIERFDENATSFEQENQIVDIQRTFNKARDAINKLSIVPLNPGLESPAASPFTEDFRIKLVVGGSPNDPGIPDAPLRITYKTLRANGRMGVSTERVVTDSNGVATFRHPIPTFTGTENLTVVLDLGSYLTPLESVGRRFEDQVYAVEESAAKNKAQIPYTVVSNAKNVPTSVMILELGQNGQPTGNSGLNSGVLSALSSEGFAISVIQGDASILQGKSDSQALAAVRPLIGSGVQRVILGTGNIIDVNEGSGVTVRASVNVKVLDVNTGAILYSSNSTKRARGSNTNSAISSVFRQLGEEVGKDMVNKLP